MILARLLLPADFGTVAGALVFVSPLLFTRLFVDLGVGSALVWDPEVDSTSRSTAFWFNCILGLTTFVLLFLSAPLAGVFFRNPEVTPVLRVLSIGVVLSIPQMTMASLLQRGM